MSDEEDYDIAGTLALAGSDSEPESDLNSDNEEVQDEIVSDEDDTKHKPNKKQKLEKGKSKQTFPSLELSDDEAENESKDMASYFVANNPQAKKAKNGSFPSFGFSKFLLTNISKKGFKQPTPIQRKTIPLIMENRDVVGMARTGSGKTAAFTLPLVEKLKSHSPRVGVRAIILSPSRELASQTFKQVKEFSKGTDLRSIVLIGGDSLEEQFSSMMTNPDVIVATPGRFLHLKVEMELELKTVEYIVFDEADRLFEMGFAEQLNELIAALPSSRQSLLFSATLPRSLIDFAKAGLTNPVLVRLDAETKISDQLQMAFFSIKNNEREASLLYVLQEVIKLPLASPEEVKRYSDMEKRDNGSEDEAEDENNNKKKRFKFKKERLPPANMLPSKHSTIIFVPTKHHVEYVTTLLKDAGYLVSYIYGTLDQHARKQQLYQFRIGMTSLLVVTDVAARGIDIPILANVVNYTLPGSSKIFIHRVGRTARAGNSGWAYSIVNEKELPYLLDLELFLGRKVLLTSMHEKKCEMLKTKQSSNYVEPKVSYTDRLVLGSIPRVDIETFQELYENILRNHYELSVVKGVATKGEKLYYRTRQSASQESLKRSKEILSTGNWDDQHLLFGPNLEKEKEKFLTQLLNRKSKETVFEFNKKGNDRDEDSLVEFMHKRRKQIAPIQRRAKEKRELLEKERMAGLTHGIENEILKNDGEIGYSGITIEADEEELQDAFEDADELIEKKKIEKKKSFRDPQYFLSHYAPAAVIQDQQLSLSSSFANDAAKATFDLDNDEKLNANKQVMQWDRKKGNYVNAHSTDKKFIIGESGQKIPATYRSGRFDDWKKQRNLKPTKTGAMEANATNGNDRRFKHKKVASPKLPDKFRDDYHKQKEKVKKAVDSGLKVKGYNKPGQKQELRSTEDIRKAREAKDKKKQKNARPSRKRK
ncbi:DEHA2F16720p [Debaryomyces hansenii CBS767]|uniref:ATP-dependent RNA helicase DBP10 n=1 Tax=Debaryomyces hansenii (strain ATCC 36239 / CBS 767 / BCRC 21394 / JCM 1990 / NBRC 0083 / IGC 2968) TaxID=284592 RepID=DBP10_DEBHA|nr:DEHA2F16720p [Debaryomyces hansenii CBS767]Q6BL34.2 RecName: Full=ATP-dependent RNA helicase DBP10 [Debaryomyces hansenii CBS767]CAG89469.2 DEHA2F16720p [Debaryomyces hansenii CBS767]|eukprot:XP_461087.2 DEHA2F16720p [Debaryomyces hansenii CBS767]